MRNRLFSFSTSYSRLKAFEDAKKLRSLTVQLEKLRNKTKSLNQEFEDEKKQNPKYKKEELLTYTKFKILSDLLDEIEKVVIPFNNYAPASDTEEPKAVLLLVQNLLNIIDKEVDAKKIKQLIQHRNDKRYYANLAYAIGYFVGGSVMGATQTFIGTYLQAYGYVNAYQLYREGFDNYVSESLKIVMELYKTLSLLEQELKNIVKVDDEKTYYEILNVLPNATSQEIKKQYFNLAKLHHPDKQGDAETFIKITRAKEVLLNPEARAEYDKSININLQQYGFRR